MTSGATFGLGLQPSGTALSSQPVWQIEFKVSVTLTRLNRQAQTMVMRWGALVAQDQTSFYTVFTGSG